MSPRLQRLRDDLLVLAAFLAMLAAAWLAGCSSATEPAPPCDVQAAGTFTPADTVYVGLCVTTWRMP